ncbi:putative exported protein [Aliivibrio wodanis]|uniref:Putative exported protein n=1 Tax=Aliivibrio wodanis TaxID=80852 RepID=A0A090IAZ0_9GAMM|nr:putative exported protein [Aliivibrio wodanis]VVV05699.1 hypothetical protein AW0309160_03182 [Aliivibrio wodanis]
MKRIIPVLLLGIAAPAHAVGTINQIYIQPSIASLHVNGSDASGLMTQVGYTYHFTPMFAADISYLSTGSIKNIAVSGDSASISGYSISSKLYFPATYYGSFYGKLGFNHTELKYSSTAITLPYDENETTTKPYIAVGGMSYLFPSMAVNFEYQYIGLSSNNYASSIGAGINIFF